MRLVIFFCLAQIAIASPLHIESEFQVNSNEFNVMLTITNNSNEPILYPISDWMYYHFNEYLTKPHRHNSYNSITTTYSKRGIFKQVDISAVLAYHILYDSIFSFVPYFLQINPDDSIRFNISKNIDSTLFIRPHVLSAQDNDHNEIDNKTDPNDFMYIYFVKGEYEFEYQFSYIPFSEFKSFLDSADIDINDIIRKEKELKINLDDEGGFRMWTNLGYSEIICTKEMNLFIAFRLKRQIYETCFYVK